MKPLVHLVPVDARPYPLGHAVAKLDQAAPCIRGPATKTLFRRRRPPALSKNKLQPVTRCAMESVCRHHVRVHLFPPPVGHRSGQRTRLLSAAPLPNVASATASSASVAALRRVTVRMASSFRSLLRQWHVE